MYRDFVYTCTFTSFTYTWELKDERWNSVLGSDRHTITLNICPSRAASSQLKIVLSWLAGTLQYFDKTFVYLRIEFVQSECEISRDEMYIRAEYISLLDSTFRYFDHHFLFNSGFLVQTSEKGHRNLYLHDYFFHYESVCAFPIITLLLRFTPWDLVISYSCHTFLVTGYIKSTMYKPWYSIFFFFLEA